MIRNFKDKHAERLYHKQFAPRFSGIERQALRRLRILESADTLQALAMLPSNWFEALKGDRRGHIAFASMRNGASAFDGMTMAHMMLRLWIIIEEK